MRADAAPYEAVEGENLPTRAGLYQQEAEMVAKSKSLKTGDRVSWKASQGTVKGKVVGKKTSATKVKTHRVAASKQNPQYLVKSDKTGAKAAHKASALKKA
jgi:hypothetical protein